MRVYRAHARLSKCMMLAGSALMLSGMPAAALAQEAQSPGSTQTADTRASDIVVTAQKREERLQEVPISIAVVSAKTLDTFSMNEATDLQYIVPGVQVLNAAGPRSFGFYIRGIGTTSFSSESVEGSVAYVMDGVVLGQSGASLADLPDIERIEVLRGPQGTLFGKNASAGVINVVTRKPSDHWEGTVSGSWAWPYDERKLSGLITGPISDDIASCFPAASTSATASSRISTMAAASTTATITAFAARSKSRPAPISPRRSSVTGGSAGPIAASGPCAASQRRPA